MSNKQKVQDVCWKCGQAYPHTTPEAKAFHNETVTELKKHLRPGEELIPGNTYRELDAHQKRLRGEKI